MKELTDVTLEDVVRYKGSRWKAKLDRSDADREKLVETLAQFLNDMPECRKLRAYVFFGDGADLSFDTTNTDYMDMFYSFFAKHAEHLDALKVPDSLDFPQFEDINIDEPDVLVTNPEYARLENKRSDLEYDKRNYISNIEGYQCIIDDHNDRIISEEKKIRNVVSDIDSIDERLDRTDREILINKGEQISNIDKSLRRYGMIPVFYHPFEDKIDVVFSVYPRLMYDVSISRKPLTTMPFLMKASIKDYDITLGTFLCITRAGGGYRAPHPHVNDGVCWGSDLNSKVREAKKEGDYDTVFRCLDTLIRSYNSGSPYVTYGGYKRSSNYNGLCGYKNQSNVNRLRCFIDTLTIRIGKEGRKLFREFSFTDICGSDLVNNKTTPEIIEYINLLENRIKEIYSEQQKEQSDSQETKRETTEKQAVTIEDVSIAYQDLQRGTGTGIQVRTMGESEDPVLITDDIPF